MKEERHKKIIEKLNKDGIVNIEELSKELKVVKITIRRDLKELEKKKALIRVHGGATLRDNGHLEAEILYRERANVNVESKDYAAKLAANMIGEGDIVYIGPGTTTEKILSFVKNKKLMIVTNSLSIIMRYHNNPNFKMLVLGGLIREDSEAITSDYFLESIRKINVNKGFVGTSGINNEKITTSSVGEGLVEQMLLKNAQQKYVVTDSSKFNKEAIFSFLEPDEITAVITDDKLSKKELKKYKEIYRIINKSDK